jgi:2-amino-4-hydroxy-6-hydroxymethyldihydropteridine diphosphokinase
VTPVPVQQSAVGHRAPAEVQVYVGIGSNVEPAKHIRAALRNLRSRFGPLSVSSLYRSRAAGFDGDDFLNLVIGFASHDTPRAIVAELERLHEESGRVRAANPFSPRTLDLDLLLYGDQVIDDMQVPRADITRYSFVLGPLAELAPDLRHPVTGETMAVLWQRFDRSQHPIQRLPSSPMRIATGNEPG